LFTHNFILKYCSVEIIPKKVKTYFHPISAEKSDYANMVHENEKIILEQDRKAAIEALKNEDYLALRNREVFLFGDGPDIMKHKEIWGLTIRRYRDDLFDRALEKRMKDKENLVL
jgi:hypothetical protein